MTKRPPVIPFRRPQTPMPQKQKIEADVLYTREGLQVAVAAPAEPMKIQLAGTHEKPLGFLIVNGKDVAVFRDPVSARTFAMQPETTAALAHMHDALVRLLEDQDDPEKAEAAHAGLKNAMQITRQVLKKTALVMEPAFGSKLAAAVKGAKEAELAKLAAETAAPPAEPPKDPVTAGSDTGPQPPAGVAE